MLHSLTAPAPPAQAPPLGPAKARPCLAGALHCQLEAAQSRTQALPIPHRQPAVVAVALPLLLPGTGLRELLQQEPRRRAWQAQLDLPCRQGRLLLQAMRLSRPAAPAAPAAARPRPRCPSEGQRAAAVVPGPCPAYRPALLQWPAAAQARTAWWWALCWTPMNLPPSKM